MVTSGEHAARDDARDGDRLPWLETVDDDYEEGPSVLRIVLLVAIALAVLAAVVFGYQYYRVHHGVDGNGGLIGAQEGDYKVKPDDPGGTKVDGEGDTAIATSNGSGTGNAAIDMKATPEKPIAGKKAVAANPAGSSKTITAIPAAGATAGGALVQIGSFPDEASANVAWGKVSHKLAFLAPLGKSVQAAQVNGRTVYRLRVNAGSAGAATTVCGKLKAAGEACFIPRA